MPPLITTGWSGDSIAHDAAERPARMPTIDSTRQRSCVGDDAPELHRPPLHHEPRLPPHRPQPRREPTAMRPVSPVAMRAIGQHPTDWRLDLLKRERDALRVACREVSQQRGEDVRLDEQ